MQRGAMRRAAAGPTYLHRPCCAVQRRERALRPCVGQLAPCALTLQRSQLTQQPQQPPPDRPAAAAVLKFRPAQPTVSLGRQLLR
jgi:hypothetical protein